MENKNPEMGADEIERLKERYFKHEKEVGNDFEYEPIDLAETLRESEHIEHKQNRILLEYGLRWYTPQVYIDAARELMGEIDIDPATELRVQKRIKAKVFYTDDPGSDGLAHHWYGKLWLNPPYDEDLIRAFINKAIVEYVLLRNVTEGLILTHTSQTSEDYFINALQCCSAVCFIHGRVRWWKGHWPEEIRMEMWNCPWRGPKYSDHSNCIFYLGNNPEKFREIFSRFGVCCGK